MSEDSRLLRQLRRCDPEALRCIYEKLKDDLLTVAVCLLGDVGAAEDCLHDVFVSLADRADKLNIRKSLKGYLINSIANRARDLLRKRSRLDVSVDQLAEMADDDPAPTAKLISREETAHVYKVLAKLPYQQREVVTLHQLGGQTFSQIAQIQAVSINTAQSRYRYGIDKLRTLLNNEVPK